MWPGYKLYSAIKLIIEGDSLTARAKIYFWRAERSVEASNHYNGLAYERVWTLTAAVGFDPEIDLEGLERPETAVPWIPAHTPIFLVGYRGSVRSRWAAFSMARDASFAANSAIYRQSANRHNAMSPGTCNQYAEKKRPSKGLQARKARAWVLNQVSIRSKESNRSDSTRKRPRNNSKTDKYWSRTNKANV